MLKILSLDQPLSVGLEEEQEYDWTEGLLHKLEDRAWMHPQVTFQQEDIDQRVVRELIPNKDLLEAIEAWITRTDYSLQPKLIEAKRVFESIQTPPCRGVLYRGFSANGKDIEDIIADVRPGDTFEFTPRQMLSFSFHQGTVKDFGDTIISIDYQENKDRCLHITNEVVMAYMIRDIPNYTPSRSVRFPTFGESVFLPDGGALTCTLISKG